MSEIEEALRAIGWSVVHYSSDDVCDDRVGAALLMGDVGDITLLLFKDRDLQWSVVTEGGGIWDAGWESCLLQASESANLRPLTTVTADLVLDEIGTELIKRFSAQSGIARQNVAGLLVSSLDPTASSPPRTVALKSSQRFFIVVSELPFKVIPLGREGERLDGELVVRGATGG